MDPLILRKLRMEGCGHRPSLPDGDWVGSFRGDDFDSRTDAGDFWGADENHFERAGSELAGLIARSQTAPPADPYASVPSFEQLLRTR